MKITEEIVQQTKTEAGVAKVHQISTDYAEALFRMPTEQEWDRFLSESSTGAPSLALKPLVCSCILWPKYGSPEFKDMVKAHPAVIQAFGGDLCEIAGATKKVEKKEL